MLEKTQQEKAQQVLSELLRLLGTTAQVLCLEQDDDFRLSVQSEEAGRLIGRKGQTLESLELILNRILRCQHNNDESLPWVPVEVDGYSVTRRGNGDAGRSGGHEGGGNRPDAARMEGIARDAAKEVKRWRSARQVGPFTPAERRLVHLTLRDDPEVETISDEQADANGCKRITIRLKENA